MTDMFQIPQGLYGRAQEIENLLHVYGRAVHGTLEAVWVTGDSGYGKSFLIAETMKTIMKDNGWFLSGRFEPNKQHVSYHALSRALRQLVRQLLTEKGSSNRRVSRTIAESAGNERESIDGSRSRA